MAIHKKAKNIEIKVQDEYHVQAGKLVKIADRVLMEAQQANLSLNSNKKIQVEGNKKMEN
ncbi:hypothetical protein [Apibacter adventoris]|uniref:Uncharacterized protein n=1 Tax=Apibacter adventoris TaxID=1679466 RepID=A0A2S8ACA9_9FLAO|nr:hypothetical protein [Apibacter adventoris]PQL92351.1 hypothetical protein C4S77_06680 [Apibacter adventoris]